MVKQQSTIPKVTIFMGGIETINNGVVHGIVLTTLWENKWKK
jgi:hypothetical protein